MSKCSLHVQAVASQRGGYATSTTALATGLISPAPASGILTMPAFWAPVSGKMRTVASRVLDRLLCSQANFFSPSGEQIELHERYMSHADNPAPREHLDSRTSCYSCHVNLDPLASALSASFLRYVGIDDQERNEVSGQFVWIEKSYAGGEGYLGARGSSEVGEGALLGNPARGFAEVGAILSESPEFYRCTVTRAFEKVLGRVPLLQDQSGFNQIADSFYQHRDFDRMIRDLVKSRSYQREN